MKAIIQEAYGGNEVLHSAEIPKPDLQNDSDILVKVKAVATNPIDWKVRQGAVASNSKPDRRLILGWDASGVVEVVGKSVKSFKPGDEVFFAGSLIRDGCFAEYVVVDERLVGRKPKNVSFEEAAAFPITGLTVFEGIIEQMGIPIPKSKSEEEENASKYILIVGGAGGVGSMAVQIAKKVLKLKTIATASRPETSAFCKKMGADYVLDHTKPYADQLKQVVGVESIDFAFVTSDFTQSSLDSLTAIVRPFGKIGGIVKPEQPLNLATFWLKSINFCWVLMFTRSLFGTKDMEKQRSVLNLIAEYVEKGILVPHVGKHFQGMKHLKEALELQQSNKAVGKITLSAIFE